MQPPFAAFHTFLHSLQLSLQRSSATRELGALLQVKNVGDDASAGPLELAGVNVDFRGTERIDRSWIGASYAPTRGPVRRDGKREVRTIVETPPARLVMQDTTLLLGESRVWLVR